MILGAGGDIFFGESDEEPLEFLFTRDMGGNIVNEVAILAEPSAITALRTQRKMLSTNDIRHFLDGLFRVHVSILIYEPVFVY